MKRTLLFIFCTISAIGCMGSAKKPSPTLTKEFAGVEFHYPSTWIIEESQNPRQMTIRPPGSAIDNPDGTSSVRVGIYLQVTRDESQTTSLRELTKRTVTQQQKSNPHLQFDLNSMTETGNEACLASSNPNPPYQGTELAVTCSERLAHLVAWTQAFAPTSIWAQYEATFQEIENSFNLSLSERLESQTTKVLVPNPAYTQWEEKQRAGGMLANESPTLPNASHASVAGQSRARSNCESGHWIESVADDGKIIKLEDDSLWEVDDSDTVDTALWLPTTDVVVCPSKMVNVEDDESASVTSIRAATRPSGSASDQLTIEAASADGIFVIKGRIFKSKTACSHIEVGDRVKFLQGSASSACASGQFVDLSSKTTCAVWCK